MKLIELLFVFDTVAAQLFSNTGLLLEPLLSAKHFPVEDAHHQSTLNRFGTLYDMSCRSDCVLLYQIC